MRIKISVIFSILIIVSSCHTGTKIPAPTGQPVLTTMNGTEGLESKVKISGNAQVYALTNIDAPGGFKTVAAKNNEWSFYLIRFNLQALPLNREEIKSTYFSVDFKIKESSHNQLKKIIIDKLYPTSTSRKIYGFESDITAGGELGLSAEAGYGWSLTDKKEKKESEKETKGQKNNLTEKLIITEREITTVTEEVPDESGKKLLKVKTSTSEKSKTSETEKYDKKSLDASLIRTLEKITDINLSASAKGKAYFEASAKFTASYKKEKWEPLITSIGSLSQKAQWLDRQPFQNGDKYFSVILKIRKPHKYLAEFLNSGNIRSKKAEIIEWAAQDIRQIDRYKIYLRSINKDYLKTVFSIEEKEIIEFIKAEIEKLETKVEKEKNNLKTANINEKQLFGYIHDHLKLLYKYQSFAEVYDETLKAKISLKKEAALNNSEKFAVAYQLKQLEKIREDIQILISKRELQLYQISVKANAEVTIDGKSIKCKETTIDLNEPERLISIVVK